MNGEMIESAARQIVATSTLPKGMTADAKAIAYAKAAAIYSERGRSDLARLALFSAKALIRKHGGSRSAHLAVAVAVEAIRICELYGSVPFSCPTVKVA